MIVVLASRYDAAAPALVERWAHRGARLLTPADLSQAGWRYTLGGKPPSTGADDTAVISGEIVPCRSITGVLARLPAVVPEELTHVVPSDRDYVASEMQAFLVAWLTSLACPVHNRPTPVCLTGVAWRQPQWLHAAAMNGLPVAPRAERAQVTSSSIVAGDRYFGDAAPHLATGAIALARAAGMSLLRIDVSRGKVAGVDVMPDLRPPAVADAVLSLFERGRTR